ncbi:unnamed protein product [Oikopleura dioica]|uniref:Uncharacterized protein n=1 Tax=Oikopleura dioica TaxID=34765 RepID=E4XZV0_OIKDI|nr:unnamed protein product [Oikopleura dioica]
MGRKKTSKKENKEPEILPAKKRRRISLDDDDDVQIVAVEYENPIKLEANFPKSDQQARKMNDDGVFMRAEDIPGPSNRNFQFEFGENAGKRRGEVSSCGDRSSEACGR